MYPVTNFTRMCKSKPGLSANAFFFSYRLTQINTDTARKIFLSLINFTKRVLSERF